MVEVVPALGRVGCGRLPPLHPPVCPEVGSGKSYNPGSSVCTPAPPQICFLMAVTVIGQRMNFMVILHGCWLVALLTRRHRAAIARLWPNYCLFLALFLLYQYLLCLGIPPALCLGELAASTEGVGVPGGGYGIPRGITRYHQEGGRAGPLHVPCCPVFVVSRRSIGNDSKQPGKLEVAREGQPCPCQGPRKSL